MPLEIRIPSLGDSIKVVEIGEWYRAPGDAIRKGDELVIIESSKASQDLPSPVNGVLTEIVAPTGSVVQIGEVIAIMEPTPATV